MEGFKGTQGKWEIGFFSARCVYVKQGPVICEMRPNNLTGCTEQEEQELKNEIKANAILISKAPEMLEMLQFIASGQNVMNEDIKDLIKQATEL